MENKLISIIIPIYNSQKNLNRCLDSCLNQTYRNIEIICVNDGSKDNSLNILNKYKDLDSRIVIVNQDNTGISCARNAGIDISKGEYITFLDSDDYLFENAILTMVNIIEQKDVDIVRTRYRRVFDHKANKINNNSFIKNQFFNRDEILNKIVNNLLSGSMSSHVWLLCVKRNIIFENQIRFNSNIKIMEDKLFCIDLFLNAYSFYQSDEITYNYYCNLSSSMMSRDKCLLRLENIIKVTELCEKKFIGINEEIDLNLLYTSHALCICRELSFFSSKEIIEFIRKLSKTEMFNKIIKNSKYNDYRLDYKIILYFLKNQKYVSLRFFTFILSFIRKIQFFILK